MGALGSSVPVPAPNLTAEAPARALELAEFGSALATSVETSLPLRRCRSEPSTCTPRPRTRWCKARRSSSERTSKAVCW
jgi:hypothetical protein